MKTYIKTVEFICLEKGSLRQFLRYCIYLAYFLIIKISNTHRVFAVYACQRVGRFKIYSDRCNFEFKPHFTSIEKGKVSSLEKCHLRVKAQNKANYVQCLPNSVKIVRRGLSKTMRAEYINTIVSYIIINNVFSKALHSKCKHYQ